MADRVAAAQAMHTLYILKAGGAGAQDTTIIVGMVIQPDTIIIIVHHAMDVQEGFCNKLF